MEFRKRQGEFPKANSIKLYSSPYSRSSRTTRGHLRKLAATLQLVSRPVRTAPLPAHLYAESRSATLIPGPDRSHPLDGHRAHTPPRRRDISSPIALGILSALDGGCRGVCGVVSSGLSAPGDAAQNRWSKYVRDCTARMVGWGWGGAQRAVGGTPLEPHSVLGGGGWWGGFSQGKLRPSRSDIRARSNG